MPNSASLPLHALMLACCAKGVMHALTIGAFFDPAQRLKQLQARQADGKPVLLRIEVEGGGCSGYQYKFSLDHQTAESDK